MDFFSVQETFKNMFPDKLKTFTFDDKCIRKIEMIFTEGNPHPRHHIEYDKIKVSIDGIPDQYVQIMSHREIITQKSVKEYVASKNDVHINDHEAIAFRDMSNEDKKNHIKQWSMMSGLSETEIENKFNAMMEKI